MQIIHRHPSDLVWFRVEWFPFEWIALVWSLRYNWFVGYTFPLLLLSLFYFFFLSLETITRNDEQVRDKSAWIRIHPVIFFFFFFFFHIWSKQRSLQASNLNSCWLTDIHLAIRFNVWPSFHHWFQGYWWR